MKKILKNKTGMTLVEVLVAVMILVIMIWTFAPFIASTFKQIAQAGRLHVELSSDVSTIDSQLADEYYGIPRTFPVKIGGDDSIDVPGFLLTSGSLNTFFSEVSSYISTDDILYEGYGSDGFYDNFYSIGFLPEITDKKFFKNDHTYVVTLTGADGFEYLVDEEFDVLSNDPKFDIDMDTVEDGASVFIVASQFPDGMGGNPDKIGYILIVPDTLGLDNSNSPYELTIMTKDTGQYFVEEPIVIEIMLPLYQAVGNEGFERIASDLNYWVDKYSFTDSSYGDTGITITRLPSDVTFNDMIWYEDETMAKYFTVGNNGNLWWRENQVPWTQTALGGTTNDLRRIKHLNGTFITAGENGAIYTSSNGEDWNNKSVLTTETIEGLSYGAGRYIAITGAGSVYHSMDLTAWTYISAPESGLEGINDVVWTGAGFLAVGDSSFIAFSPDGLIWSQIDSDLKIPAAQGNLNALIVYRSMGIIVGDNGQIHRFGIDAADAASWTWATVRSPNESQKDFYDITYSRGAFVAVGEDGELKYSLNGSVWTDCITMEGFDREHEIYGVAGRE
ncbi:MAG: type II secretion system protein [Clostridia bacterium]|nr:type II secretion system protein [Clostridia bacterium]